LRLFDNHKERNHLSHRHFRTETIFLRRGQTASRTCGVFSGRTIHRTLRPDEVLIAICLRTRRRFIFVCGIPLFARTIFLGRGTRIVVRCRRNFI
jgi:hypothetical protein